MIRRTVFNHCNQECIKDIESELSDYLMEQKRRLGCAEIKYWGSAKDRYQLEVPDNIIAKKGQVRHGYK